MVILTIDEQRSSPKEGEINYSHKISFLLWEISLKFEINYFLSGSGQN